MDKEAYFDTIAAEVADCLDSTDKHAVLIVFDGKKGLVRTYSINAEYEMVRMLIGSANSIVADDMEERVMN